MHILLYNLKSLPNGSKTLFLLFYHSKGPSWNVCVSVCVYMFEYGVLALMDLCVYTDACWGVYMDVEAKDFECLLPNLLLDLEFPQLA